LELRVQLEVVCHGMLEAEQKSVVVGCAVVSVEVHYID
jgi:hypothetical protein